MEIVWIAGAGIAAIWLIVRWRRRRKTSRAFLAMDAIEPWFRDNGLDFQTAIFGSYEDPALMSAGGTMIVVGTVNRLGAQRVGFLVEMTYGRILEAKFFEPAGIATWHRTDAREAKLLGVSLLEVIQRRERQHREQYPPT